MELRVVRGTRAGVIRLTGQFWEPHDVRLLQGAVERLCAAKQATVVLDIERLTFIGSLGLGALAQIHARLHAEGGRLLLAKPVGQVRETVALSEFSTVMPVVSTDEELAALLADPHQ